MKIIIKHIIFYIAILSVQNLISQNFKATVSKSKLGINERLRITYSIDKQGTDDFTPPKFQNFDVVGGPFQSTNFQYINGKQSFEQSYGYTLQPKNKGKFTIPPATITYDGKTLQSNEIQITVKKAIQKPKDPNDPTEKAIENIHLVAEISNTKPYIGENISVVYKLYMNRNKAAVNNERETKTPTFNGFWNQNIPIKQLTEQRGKYKGEEMSYYVLRKVVLIPQRAGKLIITPLEIDVSAIVAGEIRRDIFGRRVRGQKQVTLTLSTGSRAINVQELPETDKPTNFAGAVGEFAFKVNSTKSTLRANESAQIKVIVSGNGNIKLISLPKIETPKGLEQYEPEHKENVKIRLKGLSGTISETYTVVPQYRGKYKIPSLRFSYFNPKTKEYKTLNSTALILNVPEGKMPEEEIVKQGKIPNNVVIDTDIRSIHTKTKLVNITEKGDFFKSNIFYLLLLLPLLSIPIGIYLGKKKRERDGDIAGNKKRKANKLAKKYLSEAKKQLGKKEPFYIALEKALHNYLKAKLQIETSEISKEKIGQILENRDVEKQTIQKFIKVLDDCDFARYTPTSNLQMKKEYNKAVEIITELDKQL